MQNSIVLNAIGELLLSNKLNKVKYLFGLMLCVGSINLTVSAFPWDLDTAFGSGGKVVWSPNGNTQSVAGTGMALQADGKIVMVGGYSENAGVVTFVVTRFNSDGSIDTTFGNTGSASTGFGGTIEYAQSVAVQTDGKIVVGGRTDQSGTSFMAVAKFNSDGSLDTTFDGDGKAVVDVMINSPDYLEVLRVANDGKIVIAGEAVGGGTASFHRTIARLNQNGSLDTTFGGSGRVIESNGTGSWRDLIIHSNGSITLTGSASAQFSSFIGISRYNSNGSNAWSWGRNSQPGCYTYLNGIAEQSDGKVVAVGSNLCRAFAIRLNTDGSEDTTFNTTPIDLGSRGLTVAVQADGKLLAAVTASNGTSDGFSLVRYNTNGTLDTGFGNAGYVRVRVLSGTESAADMVIQPDGKILLGGGSSVTNSSGYRFAMVRYLGATSVTPLRTSFDYDGDGRADVSVFRPSENKWYVLKSSDSSVIQPVFGLAGDIPTPADFDGDNKTDVAVFRPSTGVWWYLSSINNSQNAVQWGQSGDVPRPSDFDGDGKTDFVVYRPSNGVWYRLNEAGQSSQVTFGLSDDKPVTGDFDGDGKSDPAIYRPSTGTWWYAASSQSNAHRAVQFGISSDTPAPADYDGDGKTDLAVYRATDGVWHILRSGNQSYAALQFGLSEDKPTAADYDGDGKADIAVFRPSTGVWYLNRSSSGFNALQWGISTDIPTQNAFVP